MSRRLSSSTGEIESGTPLRYASPLLASPWIASTRFEESDSEESDGTELVLLGHNNCSRFPAKGAVKVESPKAEADNYFVWSSINPPPNFETICNARGEAYRNLPKLKGLPLSTSGPPIHFVSVAAKADDCLAHLEGSELAEKDHYREQTVRYSEGFRPSVPKSQEDNIQNNTIHNDDVHSNETSIVQVTWVLLLTFNAVIRGTSRLVLFSTLVPLLFVKRTGLFVLCALFEVVGVWLLFANQCYNILLLIIKKLTLLARIQCIKGLIWALKLLKWSITFKTALRRDEGPAATEDKGKAMDHDVCPSTEATEPMHTCEEAPPPLPINPRFVSTAMPSAYWAGRFTSLHDRFHNEILGPRNLNLIIEAHTFLSTTSGDLNNSSTTPSPPASAFNNPSTSVYASSRIVPIRDLSFYTPAMMHPNADQLGLKTTENRHIPHYIRCIPHSATTDAILQSSRKSSTYVSERNPAVYKTVQHEETYNPKVPSPSMIPTRVIPRSESSRILPRRPLPEPPVSESSRVLPRRPLPELSFSESSNVIHVHPPTDYNNRSSMSFRMKNTDRPNRIMSESRAKAQKEREAMLRRVTVADATALTDDDNRCRRVFVHLEACCVTDEARNSLYAWQQDYARRTQREVLLPKGGTMHGPRGFKNSVFGRSLFGSRRSRGSLPAGSGGGSITTGLNVDLGQPQSEVRPSKTERSLLQVPRRVFTHGRSASMKVDSMEPSSYGHRLERHGTVRGVEADNEVRKERYQHRMSLA
ncbi:uncharacterized protein B0T23DRAFT_317099 [Neurospora hispaniola]|uniref:Uncharacterized protein n=1 Tax=Neurospora hispaniola TaxID=588809 RepID=A0AAJ0I8G5_9PEZI|nr:hypothetical protein B0T23DRAFT_317099 [Neurospora hispaniola]